MPERFTFEKRPHGAGGFAKVIRGRDNYLERDIAIKVLDPLVTMFPKSDQERFRREARILAKLNHPNIPAIYDVEFEEKKFLIVFQFIEGPTLRNLLEEQGPCGMSQVKNWFHQIASALEHAHSLGIIHRDIKPENIIIRPDGESAYLVDFGIALSAEDAKRITKSGIVFGTAGYMSPEQQAGDPVDQRSDIYSLGVTLYEALAGKPLPHGEYEELAAANEAIPPQIDDLIRDCIAPKERRLATIREFSARLSGALRAARPLSDVLVHGRLHELASAIEELTPSGFMALPEGQRGLILAKVDGILNSSDQKLHFASEKFLTLLLARGILLDQEQYREIVSHAIRWGFEMLFEGFVGRPSVRDALEEAAYFARGDNHQALQQEVANFLKDQDFGTKDDWYLHAVRKLLEAILSNPGCTEGAPELIRAYKQVSKPTRGRTEERTEI